MLRSAVIGFLFICICCVRLNGQSTNCLPVRYSQSPVFWYPQIHKDSNIVYATSKNYFSDSTESLTMDVYYPNLFWDSLTNRPVILLIHGGSFLTGNKSNMDYLCLEFASRGYVAITIDYRLGWNCPDTLPACQYCLTRGNDLITATYEAAQDARAALRFIHANATNWNADPNWIFIGGVSAGAITSYHAAFWDQSEANAFAPWAVGQVGTLDTAGNSLPIANSVRGIIDVCGGISNDSDLVNNGSIPLISFHDQLDCVVPDSSGPVLGCYCQPYYWVSGSHATSNRLNSVGVCTEENVLVGSSGHCLFPSVTVVERTSCFLKRVMCSTCVSAFNTDSFAISPCDTLGTSIRESGLGTIFVKINPNPATDFVELQFSEPSHESGVVSLYDAVGQLIYVSRIPFGSSSVQLDVSKQPEGLYFLLYSDDRISSRKKLVISR